MKILANDGISQSGVLALENAGYEVQTVKVAQDQLANYINQNNIEILLVRSATKVRQELIDATKLKLIGRGGVGLDNIDVAYAESKGIPVINTPAASSRSVAEMVFAHIFSGIRFLKDANQEMPLEGDVKFKELKKAYSKATELKGKTLGIIGFGRIGKEVAKMAIALGMRVIASTDKPDKETVTVDFYDNQSLDFVIKKVKINELLSQSDIISLHVPAQKSYMIGEAEIDKMKKGSAIINTARGGVLDEVALIKALDSGKLAFAGLDVFEKEPTPEIQLLMHPGISLSPHIAGSTVEAQDRIGSELAEQIIEKFGKQ
ncbi:D-2-hydroxyacid dehydrogenase [Mesonia sp. K7]|uniref:D-2-hydroxyacid dehydrogenase n=1 Tax=Mesonia sp. K7 TaxID=2218606 RepID=UPI000DA726A0|nr:D-2-hydroxyacid dehydrogenase [Mesonia sp. K7]PZD79287.1 3-phosphoglycerate dehydrogenase [Mesonia sp. K7]